MGSRQRSYYGEQRGDRSRASSRSGWVLLFVFALSLFLASLMILTSAILGSGGGELHSPLSTLGSPFVPESAVSARDQPEGAVPRPRALAATLPPEAPPSLVAQNDPALQRVIEDAIGADAGHLSVAVRRLGDGRTASVDGDRVFYAASTFKLAILYEAQRQRSLGLLDLDDELTLSEEDAGEDLGTLGAVPFEAGGGVTVRNALRAMITVSDNSSAVALLHHLGGGIVDGTLRRLGLSATSVNTTGLPTTANDMAILMETIATGRGVSADAREEMRALLLDQRTRFGIPQGVPIGVPIGNKTGTWEGATHDVAFVDAPGGAYVIAILSDRGWEWSPLARVSKAVFEAMTATP